MRLSRHRFCFAGRDWRQPAPSFALVGVRELSPVWNKKRTFRLRPARTGAKYRRSAAGSAAMVHVRRHGLSDPRAVFDELRPYRERLVMLMGKCRPFQADFLMLHAAQK